MNTTGDEKNYSLLLMRDDGKVRRLRVSPLVLRVLVTCLFLLPVLTGLGIWAAMTFWQGNTALVDANRVLERQLKETQVELERLANLEALLEQEDPARLHALVAPRVTPRQQADNPEPQAVPGTAPAPDSSTVADDEPAVPDTTLKAQGSSASPAATEGAGTSPVASIQGEPAAEAAPAAAPLAAEVTTPRPLFSDGATAKPSRHDVSPVNNGQARVDDVQAQLSPAGKVRVTFSLSNADTSRQLAGHVAIVAIDAGGTGHTLELPPEAADFRITRFKKIVAAARLPQGVTSENISLVAVEIRNESRVIFREAYPFRRR